MHGKRVQVVPNSTAGLGLGANPIGPTWDPHHYLLGADKQGRDVAARLLYGGRNSLLIGFAAALITCLAGTLIGIVAGFFGGAADAVISRLLEIVWAFPVYLFAICLSTILISQDLVFGPVRIASGSLVLPIAIIGIVYIPYVARPIRGEVLSLRQREFVEAGIGLGASKDAAAAEGHRPQRRDHGDRLLPARHGARNADRGGTVVPEHRSPGPRRELGHDHPGRQRA